jgi:[glutamine synthetase] adenylyltransferase / [glutamine synthetase]-adenylyl-L-tyrosine phosphorylase
LGSAFDIDLRLRPHGSQGLEANSFEQFKRYYSKSGDAQQFERQALIRLRFVAGDFELGIAIENARDVYTYSPDPIDLKTAIHLRQRQRTELCTLGKTNVKYGVGGIIDIEYGVQYIQLAFGHEYPNLRKSNIPEALCSILELGIIKAEEYEKIHVRFLDFELILEKS